MKIKPSSGSGQLQDSPQLSPENRLLQDIILGNLTKESLDYLGIVKRSITNALSPDVADFDKLTEVSKIQVLDFLNYYSNPAKWKVTKRNHMRYNSYRGKYDMEAIRELFADCGGSLGFELGLWGNGDKKLDINEKYEFEATLEKTGYDIDLKSMESLRNLLLKIKSLGDNFKMHYIEIDTKKLLIEKGTITTSPITMPYESDENAAIQKDARIIEKFLIEFLKKDNIGTDFIFDNPISPTRKSDSYIFHAVANLPTCLEVICGTSRGAVILNFIQTLDNDWISVSSTDPKFCFKE